MRPKRRWVWSTLVALGAAVGFSGRLAADAGPQFEILGEALHVQSAGMTLEVSLRSPALAVGTRPLSTPVAPARVEGDLNGKKGLGVSYPPVTLDGTTLEVKLHLAWSPEESLLRKMAQVRIAQGQAEVLQEVVLDRIDPGAESFWTHGSEARKLQILDGPQSHPVFLPGRFVGIEFPVASTRLEDKTLLIAHRPGVRLEPGTWYSTRTAVYGLAPRGEEVQAFQRYITGHRPQPSGMHLDYNSWWTSPVPYSEADILHLMEEFHTHLFQEQGVAFDSFCIDMGWSNPKSVWQIDPKLFPAGFSKISQAADAMHAKLGLWISPGSYYPPALDPQWAREQGLESLPADNRIHKDAIPVLCLGGTKYAQRFREQLADLVSHFDIGQLKFDGLGLVCNQTDHGHQPGAASSEAIADGLLAAIANVRQDNPEVWIEATCMGYNPSPWWLFHVNSVIGTFGDDAPRGRIPCPVYRESYTTARDYFNLQGAALLPLPAVAQEVLGIIHQTPEPFLNDAVMTILRGHFFVPVYVNPKYMDGARWKSLAAVLRWARNNADALGVTSPLLPVAWQSGPIPQFTDAGTMPREPYGYAHLAGDRGLVVLRNPWIARQTYRLALDRSLGLAPDARELSVVSLYPEPRRYAAGLKYGDPLEVPLAPYETVVLRVGPSASDPNVPPVAEAVGAQLSVLDAKPQLTRVAFRGEAAGVGPDWTCPLGDAATAVRLNLDARVRVNAPRAELLLLCEGDKPQMAPLGSVRVNGAKVETTVANSALGWSATGLATQGHWVFLRVPLVAGENQIALEEYLNADCRQVSAWVWATKPGAVTESSEALPQPEQLSLDSVALLEPVEVASLPAATASIDRPVERINGVFLDTLEPVSVAQGYGTLQKNRSVWEKPMQIAGTAYQRGLGTHAPSKIVYRLEGKYRRFQAWAGADGNTTPTVRFEVRLDGTKRWDSGPMVRETPAARVDLDLSGVQTLELIVDDLGNGNADHADWADAQLLR